MTSKYFLSMIALSQRYLTMLSEAANENIN